MLSTNQCMKFLPKHYSTNQACEIMDGLYQVAGVLVSYYVNRSEKASNDVMKSASNGCMTTM